MTDTVLRETPKKAPPSPRLRVCASCRVNHAHPPKDRRWRCWRVNGWTCDCSRCWIGGGVDPTSIAARQAVEA